MVKAQRLFRGTNSSLFLRGMSDEEKSFVALPFGGMKK